MSLGGKVFSLEELRKLSKKLTGILLIENDESTKLEVFAGNYLKLKPTEFAPTIEIDGIQMHRTKDMDPFEDSRRKVSRVVSRGDRVLDTCGGLGYTAIWSLKKGAVKVVTVERNPSVMEIRRKNPHSEPLSDSRISQVAGDIYDYILSFEGKSFNSIIHDPPRFSLAGELYGQKFYDQLYRILKYPGKVFHYVGDPYQKGRGRSFIEGVIKRMQASGFRIENDRANFGLIGLKK